VSSREQAEALRGQELCIRADALAALPEGSYYVRDLTGCAILDEAGSVLGELCDVLQSGAQDLYEIRRPDGKTFLIPAAGPFILHVDTERKRVTARVPEGLMELAR
jgi:16S rRNA processing protein RimM